jgi:hypothetical protein
MVVVLASFVHLHMRTRPITALIWFLLAVAPAFAQKEPAATPKTEPPKTEDDRYHHDWKKELEESGIQDNSFLIEEAYNQEYGIVQHISNFTYLAQSKSWVYSFTQEWPVDPAPKNQLSYTLLAVHAPVIGSGIGFGDVALNYRYQLVGNGDARVAVTPRFSVLFPSGDSLHGRGAGGVGFQTNWAMSVVFNKKLTTHWNVGATVVPTGKDTSGDQAQTYAYNLGHSFVWTARPRFNALLETVFVRAESVSSQVHTEWANQLLLNPGIRWAYNFSSGLQIVPGISMPIGVGPSSGERGVFFYLSFEHPYRKIPRKMD